MYYIVYALLYTFSLLPLKVLYLFSDTVYVLLCHVFGYRRKIVIANLRIAFPDRSEAEINKIRKDFYRNFTDNFIETIKLLSGGAKFAREHFAVDGTVLQEQYEKGK